jgi:DNA-binding transcriptional MerR regulator
MTKNKPNKQLIEFIVEARKRGFSDEEIRKALFEKSWPNKIIEEALDFLNPKYKIKNQVCIWLSNEVLKELDARAKKNLHTLPEQIEDILRRSCVNKKRTPKEEKLDDLLVGMFSRKK